MDNRKDNGYYLAKITTDLAFIVSHTGQCLPEELERNEILVDSVMFRLIQISENADKLTDAFKEQHPAIPWRAMKGMRNRIVHDYGRVDMTVIYDTVTKDIPRLLEQLEGIEE